LSKPTKSSSATALAAEPFVFVPPCPENGGQPGAGRGSGRAPAAAPSGVAFDQKAYEKGLAEGEARARAAFEKSLADLRGQLSEALRQFSGQRESYFQGVEREVIQLALSIARKILHREVQIDPLVLTAVVRVALDTLNKGTQVRLRAHPQEIPLWRDYFAASDLQPAPELIGDASLGAGCCVLETDLGNTQISLEGQLKEVEQGFLDLLQQRPRLPE